MDADDDKVPVWRCRLDRAVTRREREQKETWRKVEAAIDGVLRPSRAQWSEDNLWMGTERVHSAIRAILPSLLYSNPRFTVTPKRSVLRQPPGGGKPVDISWELARIKELALNHVWNESQGNKHARVAIVSSFIAFGALKAGYLADFEDDESRGVFATDPDTGDLLIGADGLPELEQGDYLTDDKGQIVFDADGVPELNPGKLRRETFFVDYAHYDSLLFDPDGGNVFEATHNWVAEEIMRPLCDVHDDPRYDKRLRREVTATNTVGDKPGSDKNDRSDFTTGKSDEHSSAEEDAARVKLYDIYDFKNRRIITIPAAASSQRRDKGGRFTSARTDNDVVLRDVAMPAYMEHGPFRYLRMNERPGQWYPIPDGRAMVKGELAMNLLDSQQAEHRRNAQPKWLEVEGKGFAEAEGGDEEKRKFLFGGPYTITKTRSPDGLISAPTPQLDATHFAAKGMLDRDFREAAGAPGELSGVASADTATQASILAGASDVRNNDRRDNLVQAMLSEVGRLLLQTMQANLQGSIFVTVAGADSSVIQALGITAQDFLEITRENLEGEFDVGVAVGSTQPKNSQIRSRQLLEIGTMISQNPLIGFARTYLSRLFEAHDIVDENLLNEFQTMAQMAVGPPPGQSPGGQDLASTVPNGAANGQARPTGALPN